MAMAMAMAMAMDFKSQVLPTDSLYGLSVTNMHFYSVPTSPSRRRRAGNASVGYLSSPITPQTNEDLVSNFDSDFEFETSKRFQFEGLEFETRPNFKYASGDHQHGGTTPPPMAFADELFSNGQVTPLKLPPRLQRANGISLDTAASLPRYAPSKVLQIPFSRLTTWDDDFDPFAVALEKVRGGKRGESHDKSHHRRARSLSPFKNKKTPQGPNNPGHWHPPRYDANHVLQAKIDGTSEWGSVNPSYTGDWNHHHQGGTLEPMPHGMDRNPDGLIVSKGSALARWVNKQIITTEKSSQMGLSQQGQARHKGLPFGSAVRSVKVGHEGTTKAASTTPPGPIIKTGKNSEESRKQRMKGFLPRYAASLGRERNEVKLREQIAVLWKASLRKMLAKSIDKKT